VGELLGERPGAEHPAGGGGVVDAPPGPLVGETFGVAVLGRGVRRERAQAALEEAVAEVVEQAEAERLRAPHRQPGRHQRTGHGHQGRVRPEPLGQGDVVVGDPGRGRGGDGPDGVEPEHGDGGGGRRDPARQPVVGGVGHLHDAGGEAGVAADRGAEIGGRGLGVGGQLQDPHGRGRVGGERLELGDEVESGALGHAVGGDHRPGDGLLADHGALGAGVRRGPSGRDDGRTGRDRAAGTSAADTGRDSR